MQKTQEELRKELNCAYCAANEQAHIPSWVEFARFVGVPYPTIYRYVYKQGTITESMLRRIWRELKEKGITFDNNTITGAATIIQNVTALQNSPIEANTTDQRWFDLVKEKDVQIDRLLGIIEKMQK